MEQATHDEAILDVERIAQLTREEVDALPYGLMIFDHEGYVHLYNDYESRLSRRAPHEVLGRNWFHEVAPCTRVAAFEGRFRAFVAEARADEVARFGFRFHFHHGAQDVVVSFAHLPGQSRVLVIVTRRELKDDGRPFDPVDPIVVDLDDGQARGGLGSALAPPRVFWATTFDLVGKDPSLTDAVDRGAEAWGRLLADALERFAGRHHSQPLSRLPRLLGAALVDDTLAAQGLGRLELEFVEEADDVVGMTLRGVDLPIDLAERLYERVLQPAMTALTGRAVEVVVFGRAGAMLRLVASSSPRAADAREWRRLGVEPRAIAERLGLEAW